MRTLNISLVATAFISCAALAGTGGEEGYATPQSLDSIGSMFHDTNNESDASDVSVTTNCDAEVEAVKARMAGLRAFLEYTNIELVETSPYAPAGTQQTYAQALSKLELRLSAVTAERQEVKSALVEYRELLDSHTKNSQHEAVFDDISALLVDMEAFVAKQ